MAKTKTVGERGSPPRYDLVVEKDLEIPMRDGARLKADAFRPKSGGRFPVIVNLGCYQKDKLWVPPPDLEEKPNEYMNWETANPLWWVPRGYACVRVDGRGSGKSPGRTDPWSPSEARDFYDAIEWTARQPWCNGRVGTLGISYYAMTQWLVAGLKPPSLAAMIPWEGAADMYRDFGYHGGIFCFGFATNWWNNHMAHHLLGKAQAAATDVFATPWLWEYMRYNLDGEWWRGRRANWENIDIPLLSAGNWSGMGLHLRGNTEGYARAASRHKKLRIHAGTHYHPFYSEEGRDDQLRFFDHWLKGADTGIMREPPVKLLIRRGGHGNYQWRFENEWPLDRTRWTRFYLQPAARGRGDKLKGGLLAEPPRKAAAMSYPASAMTKAGVASASWTSTALAGNLPNIGASFDTAPLKQDTEVTGPVVLVLWVSSTTEDMDIFATIRNIAPDSEDVFELGQQGQPVPVAKGWLRASHRKQDAELSLPYRPYHTHEERQWLAPREVVRVELEIWPTCMVFKKGHRLRLDIQPRDGVGSFPYTHYSADYNTGINVIYAGGHRASYLLLPVIPRND
ncbi:MAG TPA: CocE/NonD family hydrolase [Burkholderiales bacterium]|nr:CocE/NonD family hydrolase [Burkholderiales bacterium]